MKKIMIFPVLLFLTGIAFSQNLNEKWDKMLDKAETFEQYKVIKRSELADLWKSVQDSVSTLKSQLAKEKSHIYEQNVKIESLQKQVAQLTGDIENARNERDNMSFLGIQVDKYTYASMLWFVIFVILAGCGLLFYLFNNSNAVTQQTKSEYEQLSKSFEEYKQSKIEMERKLKREMQTYINKIEELKKI